MLFDPQVAVLPDILALSLTDDASRLAASSTAGIVVVVDAKGKELHSHRHPGQIDAVAINSAGDKVTSVTGGDEGDQR
jgi:hypothetical protein